MNNEDSRINELTTAVEHAERKLAERETLVTTAFKQAETARSQYEQATERAEALRRRLDAKEEQLRSLQKELQQRDQLIATLRQVCEENDSALNAINQDARRQSLADPNDQLVAMGFMLESLDETGIRHRIGRATTTLGRSPANDIAINSTSVSRHHARIVVEADAVYLVDLQSTNGCSVNGHRALRQAVNDRDVIAIGNAKFKFTFGAPAAEIEDRSMDETHALLDDAVIFSVAPKSKTNAVQAHADHAKAKAK